MTKIVIRPKYPKINYISPYTLQEPMTKDRRASVVALIDTNFKILEKWVHIERNYTS